MTVKELKKELDKYSDKLDVFIVKENEEFHYSGINSVDLAEIENDETSTEEDIIILSD